ncbi:hypothetical protein SUGI_0862740 [Cryptomeria japonica]|nr:hypothetical protein SUGI_0862740 [Cryptomeria japonica]
MNGKMMNRIDDKSLPPGFRFHPVDEELVTYYLHQKVLDSSFSCRAIAEVDLNKCEPWDLPARAKMGEQDWYFFSLRDRKYPTGLRTNRATQAGYWKATGKDREVFKGRTSILEELLRSGKRCRLRWINYLRPGVKRRNYSYEEEQTILQLHQVLGNRWSAIASHLPRRTDNEIENFWNTRLREMGFDPVTQRPSMRSMTTKVEMIEKSQERRVEWHQACMQGEERICQEVAGFFKTVPHNGIRIARLYGIAGHGKLTLVRLSNTNSVR